MTTPTKNLFASHHQKIPNPSWMNWVSGCTCFVCHVLPRLRIFTVTNTVHNFVFILYSMKSLESNYLCFFFGNLRRKASFVVTADNLTLLPTFRACTGCITGVKVVFIILCFVYFFKIILLWLLSFSLFLLQNAVIWR